MAYLTIEEINTNPLYAPLGYKEQFNKRIKDDIYEIVKNLDVKKTLTPKRIGIYYDYIDTLLDPYFLERTDEYVDVYFQPDYKTGTILGFGDESFAHWNQKPYQWKTRGCYYHRQSLKDALLKEFDYYTFYLIPPF